VVQKALLGIGILGLEDTPLSKLEYLVLQHPDPWVRNNAAFALQRVVSAGAHSEALSVACRRALIDEEPGVRAQAASVLGILRDPDAIPPLGDLLTDDVNLVVAAAATALARIGHEHAEHKGETARLLVGAFERAEDTQRPHIHRQLVYLSDRNLGEEVDEWREWAYRMP
jgi:HEAT repeat protein